MVHALTLLHNLIKPQGVLVDIHPSQRPPRIEIRQAGHQQEIGTLSDRENSLYQAADNAVAAVVRDGLFRPEDPTLFEFLYHLSAPADLVDWIEDSWTNVALDEATRKLLEQRFGAPQPDKEVIVRRWIQIQGLQVLQLTATE